MLYGFLSLGVYLSFRVLRFPDLTVDGSFPLGAAITATLLVAGVPPLVAVAVAVVGGALAGLCTGWLSVHLKIFNLLASILTMISLYSINLRIMGKPNTSLLGQATVFDGPKALLSGLMPTWLVLPLILLGLLSVAKVAVDWFLTSELGLAMRATGMNPQMAAAQGVRTDRLVLLGMALSNGLVALAGAFFAQVYGFADVTLGVGTVVAGLATVILGEALLPGLTVPRATLGVIVGSVVYRLAIALALNINFLGFKAQDLNLITAMLVVLALVLPSTGASLQTLVRRKL